MRLLISMIPGSAGVQINEISPASVITLNIMQPINKPVTRLCGRKGEGYGAIMMLAAVIGGL